MFEEHLDIHDVVVVLLDGLETAGRRWCRLLLLLLKVGRHNRHIGSRRLAQTVSVTPPQLVGLHRKTLFKRVEDNQQRLVEVPFKVAPVSKRAILLTTTNAGLDWPNSNHP